MAPVLIELRPVRIGRRLRVADALLACEGHQVGRVTAVFLPTSTEPPGNVWQPTPTDWPSPEGLPPAVGDNDVNGWLFRGVAGGFGTGERTMVWTNDTVGLVDGEAISPFVRAAVSGDIACPLANSSDQGLHFINADYTMLIGRYPIGDWVGLEIDQRISADGIAIGAATLVDETGPFATSGGTSLARPPLEDNQS